MTDCAEPKVKNEAKELTKARRTGFGLAMVAMVCVGMFLWLAATMPSKTTGIISADVSSGLVWALSLIGALISTVAALVPWSVSKEQ
jgi:hypothetical protein